MRRIGIALAAALLAPIARADTVVVSTVTQLREALAAANAAGGHRTIALADGVYTLPETLQVNAPGIAITSVSRDRTKVTVEGDVVRRNVFRHIASPGESYAEFAVHFWNGSADNLVERNVIVDCDRGIGFGLNGRGNRGGVIRNNMISHAPSTSPFADVAIYLDDSPDTAVYNNTIFMEHAYPSAIEYRFPGTRGVLIVNNLANRAVTARDGAAAMLASNVANADASWFVDVAAGNLHLSGPRAGVVDAGQAVPGLGDDFDGDARPQGAGIDIGADEIDDRSRNPRGDAPPDRPKR